MVDKLKVTKELLTKAQQDLESKTNELDAEVEKVKVCEVSTQTVSEIYNISNMKQEEVEANNEEKYNAIPCKYFPRRRRGNKCWFNHDENHKKD